MMPITQPLRENQPFRLENVRVPKRLLANERLTDTSGVACVDVTVDRGTITGIRPSGDADPEPSPICIDGQQRLLTPLFVDCHVHLDKCYIASRCPAPEGDLHTAIDATEADKPQWTDDDLGRRAEQALSAAYTAGVGVMRTHVDHRSVHAADRITPIDPLAFMAGLRDEWAGRIELQIATLTPLDVFASAADAASLADQAAEHDFVLGAFHYKHPHAETALRHLLQAAADRGLDTDFHVDEGLDADATGLSEIAAAVTEQGFPGRVLCGHACSLAVQDDATASATIRSVAEARVGIVALPTTNAFLQDRGNGRTPRQRGLTLVHELRAAGVEVAIATDNVGDPFYPYGSFDPLSTLGFAVPYGHLADPVVEWLPAIGPVAGQMIGARGSQRLAVGSAADFVLLDARDASECFPGGSPPRTVFRHGRPLTAEI